MAKQKPEIILGQFHLRGADDRSWSGVLIIGKRTRLRILTVGEGRDGPVQMAEAIKGVRVDIVGQSRSHGVLTLLGCMYTRRRSVSNHAAGTTAVEISFLASEIWAGPTVFEPEKPFDRLSLDFDGIHGVIGTRRLGRKHFASEREKEIANELLGETSEIYFDDHSQAAHEVKSDKCAATIHFGSNITTSFSWTSGEKIITSDGCTVFANGQMAGEKLQGIGHRIEEFLSFICLETVRASSLSIERSRGEQMPPEVYKRLWIYGAKRGAEKIMFHGALCDFFRHSAAMNVALQRWLDPAPQQSLARWLFLDNHDRNVISSARFVSLCQAAELLGSSTKQQPPFDRDAFAKAAEMASAAICGELGEAHSSPQTKERFRQLVLSFNRHSFRDHLSAFFDGIPKSLHPALMPDREELTRRLVKMRNLMVHLDTRAAESTEAERSLGEMTYRLLALFAVHEGNALGLPLERMHSGLANSALGRAAYHYLRKRRSEAAASDL